MLAIHDSLTANDYFYGHDHLYSVVALFDAAGDVVERYEYDAYGKASLWSPNDELRTASLFANPYLFTERRFDIIDVISAIVFVTVGFATQKKRENA